MQALNIRSGSYTIRAADGDLLSGTYRGRATATEPGSINDVLSGPSTSGTERFAGATDRLTFRGGADFASDTLHDRISGPSAFPARMR